MKTVRTWCIRILMILFTVIFLYPLFWNLMSAFKTNAEYLLCTGKISFCGQQTDLCHLYGMYFSAGYLHYDSFVSGITGCEWIK